ncbi:hypothetical protein BKA93DRAFT_749633 [Sparassis latifolia]
MPSLQPNRKRVRVDEEDPEEALVNHPTLYFDDGNIIISSGSTLFCVHRSLLSKHSPVFKDLFEPKEDKKQAFLRGCLHIHVEDDREEMEALLSIIYDGFRIDFPHLTVETYPALATLLCMTTKYQLARTRTEIIERIRREWPDTLTSHDTKMDERRRLHPHPSPFLVMDGKVELNPLYNPTAAQHEELVHPASVIALLRQTDCATPQVFAPIFYELSRCSWTFGGPAVGHNIAPLSHADIERLIVGIERLRTLHMFYAAKCPLFTVTPGHEDCLQGLQHCWGDIASVFARKTGPREPVEDWKELTKLACSYGQLAVSYQICAHCWKSLPLETDAIRSALWSQLTTSFQLTP